MTETEILEAFPDLQGKDICEAICEALHDAAAAVQERELAMVDVA